MQSSSHHHHQLLPLSACHRGGLDARAHKRARTCVDEVVAFPLLEYVEEPFLPLAPLPTQPAGDLAGDGGWYAAALQPCEDAVDFDQEWDEILQQLTDLSAPSSPLPPLWSHCATTATTATSIPSSPTTTTATACVTSTTSPSASAGCSSWNTATTSLPSSPITPSTATTTTTTTRQTARGTAIEIDLSHKPRGSGGVWFPLEQDQPLRVTKGMGKRLRVAVHSRRPFAWEELTLTLVDLTTGRTCPEMTTFPHKSTLKEEADGSTRAEVEVKIERLCSRLYIRVAIAAAPSNGDGGGGWTWKGRSGSFLTHNNGNIGRKRKIPPAKGEVQQQLQADEEDDTSNRRA